ncbi:MAG: tyrosine--tRNA ligase [Clostridiales bacterium]|nr:tyrosine--tRNA ligase [Clostridiales bacterium]
MTNIYDILMERGYIEQSSDSDKVRRLLGEEKVTFYIGFDPTAESLHVGHFIQVMVMSHLQKAGHRPIALIGGGTTMVGDPSDRTDMRKMLTKEEIKANGERFKEQFSRFLSFDGPDGAIMDNNANWLLELNYVDFLRDYGRFFSVNRMLTAECFKSRLEKGLSFLEFNYMLMQAYDFLELFRRYGCTMQFGGNDQWSNILAGCDLIRRIEAKEAFALTFKLLTTSAGKKMGKTEKGAVWLDAAKTSPYDFYQYWRNIDDADVFNCLCLLTFLSMEEIRTLCAGEGSAINAAKARLAYEITCLVHGKEEAAKAREAAEALFGGAKDSANLPKTSLPEQLFADGYDILALLLDCGLIPSKSEGRRLVKDGGIYLNDQKIQDIYQSVTLKDFNEGKLLLRKGKKVYHQVIID